MIDYMLWKFYSFMFELYPKVDWYYRRNKYAKRVKK